MFFYVCALYLSIIFKLKWVKFIVFARFVLLYHIFCLILQQI